MTVPTDPITHRKLAIVKQLYNWGVSQGSDLAPPSRIIAVIAFDLACESALHAAAVALNPSGTISDKFTFQQLIKQVQDGLSQANLGTLEDVSNLRHVHSIRNDAQHKAKYPNETDIGDARTYTRDFLQKLIRQVWDFQFENISLVDLIQSDQLRSLLSKAETDLHGNVLSDAAKSSAIAFAIAIGKAEPAIVGNSPRAPSFGNLGSLPHEFQTRISSFEDQLRRSSQSFDRLQRSILCLALGINYIAYLRFESLTGRVRFYASGNSEVFGTKKNLTREEAEFIVRFAIDATIQIESRLDDVNSLSRIQRFF